MNNDNLLCSIRGSFSLPFYNLTMQSIKMACVGARRRGSAVDGQLRGLRSHSGTTGVNVNDGMSV